MTSGVVWGSEHPLGRPTGGRVETLQTLSYETVRAYYDQHFIPANLTYVVAGNFELEDMLTFITQIVSRYSKASGSITKSVGDWKRQAKDRIDFGEEDEMVWLGFGIPIHGKIDRLTWDIINIIVNEGDSSLLQQKLREEKGLVYYLFTETNISRVGGDYQVAACVSPDNVEHVMELLQTEVSRTHEFPSHLFEVAKARYKAYLTFLCESSKLSCRFLGRNVMVHQRGYTAEQMLKELDRLEIETIRKEMKESLRLEVMNKIMLSS